jgi:hypothetical protein
MAYNRGPSWLHHAAVSLCVHTARCLSITWRFCRLSYRFLFFRLVSKHFGPFLLSSVIRKGKIGVTFTRLYIQVRSGHSSHKNCNMCATSRRVIICFILATDPEARVRFPGTTKKVVGLERDPLSLVSTTEELLDRKVAVPV